MIILVLFYFRNLTTIKLKRFISVLNLQEDSEFFRAVPLVLFWVFTASGFENYVIMVYLNMR